MMTLDDIRSRRDAIMAIAQKYGANNFRVFGSVVRGEATEQSDVDFLVQIEKGRSLLDHIGLQIDLEELLGCKVDVVDDCVLHPMLRDDILAEVVPL